MMDGFVGSLTYYSLSTSSLSGVLVMGIGSITFSLPHFLGGEYMVHDGSSASGSLGDDNICRAPKISHQSSANDLLDKLPGLDKIKSLTEGKKVIYRGEKWRTHSFHKVEIVKSRSVLLDASLIGPNYG